MQLLEVTHGHVHAEVAVDLGRRGELIEVRLGGVAVLSIGSDELGAEGQGLACLLLKQLRKVCVRARVCVSGGNANNKVYLALRSSPPGS